MYSIRLAISLVVAANFAFAQAFPKKEDEDNEYTPSNSVWDNIEDDEEDEEWDEEHALDQVLNNMVEDLDEDDFLDKTPPKSTKPTMDISVNHEDAEKWNQLADELARGTVEMQEDEDLPWEEDPDVLEFLENEDNSAAWDEEESNLVAGMTNDPEGSFMDFQNQMNAADAELEAAAEELQELEEELAREIEVIDPEEVSNRWEVEDTSGNVTLHEESDSEFPNENNPTSVAATVAEIQNKFGTYPSTVEKLETPHLPKTETTETTTTAPVVKKVIKKTVTPVETTTAAPVDEDALFDEAMRKKAEQDKLEFLRKKDEDSKK